MLFFLVFREFILVVMINIFFYYFIFFVFFMVCLIFCLSKFKFVEIFCCCVVGFVIYDIECLEDDIEWIILICCLFMYIWVNVVCSKLGFVFILMVFLSFVVGGMYLVLV